MEELEKILKQIKEDNIVCPSPPEWNLFYKRIGGFEEEEKSLKNGIKRHCQQRTCNSSHVFASNQRKNNQRGMNMRGSTHDLGIEEIAFDKVN